MGPSAPGPAIGVVVGSHPDSVHDGVGDGAVNLTRALTEVCRPELLHRPGASVLRLRDPSGDYAKFDLLHMIYPSEGWGKSVLPALLPLWARLFAGRPCVATLHEWSGLHPLRRLSLLPLVAFARGFVIASPRDDAEFRGFWLVRLLRKPSVCIPYGINLAIPDFTVEELRAAHEELLEGGRFERVFCFFGFVYAFKQPEAMIRGVRELNARGVRAKLLIVGDFMSDDHAGRDAFRRRLRDDADLAAMIDWRGFVEDEREVARLIAASDGVLALYRDGLTMRRGSFWLASQLGVPIVTTPVASPDEFRGYEDAIQSPHVNFFEETASAPDLACVLEGIPPYVPLRFPRPKAPAWPSIAHAHRRFYDQVLG